MASKVRALRALRALGDEEDLAASDDDDEEEEVTDAARAKARALYGPPPGGSDSDSESASASGSEGSGVDGREGDDWERFFELSTTKKGGTRYTCKLLGKAFTSPDAARDYVGGKVHRRAVAEAREKLLTYNERQERDAKAAAIKARREHKRLAKARAKVVAKRKATDLSAEQIGIRKARFALKKQRRLERKAAFGSALEGQASPKS
ncbi:hypothetical protein KFE25_010619 [Diacronema lutheri]|uniref:Uncharacterized protein n=1 Tax=Diacronema lutheri TaxID=2081491 RepID=A0A8J5XI26_DIALT|nr:hypothetical protein KFE25_010619 [Diacronema lutheri]